MTEQTKDAGPVSYPIYEDFCGFDPLESARTRIHELERQIQRGYSHYVTRMLDYVASLESQLIEWEDSPSTPKE